MGHFQPVNLSLLNSSDLKMVRKQEDDGTSKTQRYKLMNTFLDKKFGQWNSYLEDAVKRSLLVRILRQQEEALSYSSSDEEENPNPSSDEKSKRRISRTRHSSSDSDSSSSCSDSDCSFRSISSDSDCSCHSICSDFYCSLCSENEISCETEQAAEETWKQGSSSGKVSEQPEETEMGLETLAVQSDIQPYAFAFPSLQSLEKFLRQARNASVALDNVPSDKQYNVSDEQPDEATMGQEPCPSGPVDRKRIRIDDAPPCPSKLQKLEDPQTRDVPLDVQPYALAFPSQESFERFFQEVLNPSDALDNKPSYKQYHQLDEATLGVEPSECISDPVDSKRVRNNFAPPCPSKLEKPEEPQKLDVHLVDQPFTFAVPSLESFERFLHQRQARTPSDVRITKQSGKRYNVSASASSDNKENRHPV